MHVKSRDLIFFKDFQGTNFEWIFGQGIWIFKKIYFKEFSINWEFCEEYILYLQKSREFFKNIIIYNRKIVYIQENAFLTIYFQWVPGKIYVLDFLIDFPKNLRFLRIFFTHKNGGFLMDMGNLMVFLPKTVDFVSRFLRFLYRRS